MDKTQKLKETLDHYRRRVSILKKGYAQERYRIDQLSRSFLGQLVTNEISTVDVATYRDQRLAQINPKTNKPISAATVRLEMSLLSNCLDIARIEWGVCDGNPVKNVKKPKTPPGRERRLTAREERLILRYCHNHSNQELYSIVVLALETAMRQGEILKLEWEHINLKTRIAHLPDTKNGSKRDVPLSVKARDALIRLGVKSKGRVMSYGPNGLKSTWRFMVIKLGIEDLHFHDLRHEAISRLVELGTLDLLEVAAISGHKSLAMLKRYTHLRAQRLVRKLEGNKHKGKQAVLDHLIPYPACMEERNNHIELRLLDFDNLVTRAATEEQAIHSAQDILLRTILTSMRDAKPIPQPDQYLEAIDERKVIMIDPLASQHA
ncbi:integrase (plasmid) [Chromobacterium phragmitis]|uniref:Site-specific integrase n=1 Tax=Chromobacterium phragmitis TaxID=2202141 RepID=A0ABV0IMI0_9NEIS|nr:site-specific integrase [Chromobacterium phragmitis]AXE32483.1 integrase [Chromobacterium phragmitis]AXE32823.1 integrase [Chromobacterium phragmitis]